MPPKRIAIVGSGVSGLSALWALKSTSHDVHLYEAEDRLGGHTNTARFKSSTGEVAVDTGFIVLNTATYPNFIAFLKALDIEPTRTDMTFGISRDQGAFEWAGTSLDAIFAQRENVFKPSMWRMIFDIIRFNQASLDLLRNETSVSSELTIGQYLDQQGYSSSFRDDYLIPMTACVWSTGADKCALEFPAITLVRFLWNHHLLSTITARPDWLTIPGGSQRYIDAIMKSHPKDRAHLSTPVINATSTTDNKVLLGFANESRETFDGVILACHGPQAFSIIQDSASSLETKIMSSFETTPNTAYLHSDLALMPTRRATWSSWNYLTSSASETSSSGALQKVSLTYNMNILQHIPVSQHGDVLVTLNPPFPPKPELTQKTYEYAHPLYNPRAVAAQERLQEIQGKRGIWYAGAWTGYGFHEDGFTSGLKVAVQGLGAKIPFEVVDSKYSRGRAPTRSWKGFVLRVVLEVIQILIVTAIALLGSGRKKGKTI